MSRMRVGEGTQFGEQLRWREELWSGNHGAVTRVASGSSKRPGVNTEAFHLQVECLVVDAKKSSRLALISSSGLERQPDGLPLRIQYGEIGELLQGRTSHGGVCLPRLVVTRNDGSRLHRQNREVLRLGYF